MEYEEYGGKGMPDSIIQEHKVLFYSVGGLCKFSPKYLLVTSSIFQMRISPASGNQNQGNLSVSEQSRLEKMATFRKNILKTLAIVSLCYLICWTLNGFYFLFFNFGANIVLSDTAYYLSLIHI